MYPNIKLILVDGVNIFDAPNQDVIDLVNELKNIYQIKLSLLDPNISRNEISDELLIKEFTYPTIYKRRNLYLLMSVRANSNLIIRKYLFELILDDGARSEIEMGIITHAWLPALFILQNGNDLLKLELKKIIEQWSMREKELFLHYIKNDTESFNLLKGIL